MKVLEAIQVGELTFAELEALPSGLAGLYLEFFDRIYRRGNVDFAPARTVLQAITAAQEPPTRNDLAALTGLDAEQEIPAILRRLVFIRVAVRAKLSARAQVALRLADRLGSTDG